jgi:peroxiredoxin Q/BCP
MLEEGTVAPEFTLTSDDGKRVSLSDFRGKKVILYFYPEADTPGCTTQACAIRDVYPSIEGEDIAVIGISPDPPEALIKFREKHDLPFVLLSDPDHKAAEAYGTWAEKQTLGMTSEGIIRSHFAIDEEGRLVDSQLRVKPESTGDFLLIALGLAPAS